MLRYLRTAAAVAVVSLSIPAVANAQGVPTVDSTSISQLIAQLTQMKEDYQAQLDQITLLEEQVDNLKGLTDLSLNLPSFDFDIASFDFDKLAGDFLSGGGDGAMRQAFGELDDVFAFEGLSEFSNSDVAQERALAERVGEAAAAFGMGVAGMETANTATDRAQELADNVGGQEELKDAVDFGNAVQAEIAGNQAKLMALLSAQLKAQGMKDLAEAEQINRALQSGRLVKK